MRSLSSPPTPRPGGGWWRSGPGSWSAPARRALLEVVERCTGERKSDEPEDSAGSRRETSDGEAQRGRQEDAHDGGIEDVSHLHVPIGVAPVGSAALEELGDAISGGEETHVGRSLTAGGLDFGVRERRRRCEEHPGERNEDHCADDPRFMTRVASEVGWTSQTVWSVSSWNLRALVRCRITILRSRTTCHLAPPGMRPFAWTSPTRRTRRAPLGRTVKGPIGSPSPEAAGRPGRSVEVAVKTHTSRRCIDLDADTERVLQRGGNVSRATATLSTNVRSSPTRPDPR